MECYVYYREFDGLVVGDMSVERDTNKYKLFPLTKTQYDDISGKIHLRVVNGELLYDDYVPAPSENQLIGQQITDLEIASIIQGQQITDMELKILTMEVAANV